MGISFHFTMTTNTERSRIIMLVYETGSMYRHKPVTISSYNEWLDSNRTKEEEEDHFPKFTLVKFNTVHKLQEFESVETAPALTAENYQPNSMTALYDAIGETLECYKEEKDNIMVILTDGAENSSRKWTREMVSSQIKMFTDEKGWIFHYLGANQDAWSVGQSIGIMDKKFTTTYSADDGGFDHAFAQNVAQTKCYRGHQAMKKKGMFTPSLQNMTVPTIEKSSYLANKSSNVSVNVSVSNNAAPAVPVMRNIKKAPNMLRKSPPTQQNVVPQQQQMQQFIQPQQQQEIRQQIQPELQQVQQRIQQSQENRVQTQQDFDQLYQNSDADMQAALRNSL